MYDVRLRWSEYPKGLLQTFGEYRRYLVDTWRHMLLQIGCARAVEAPVWRIFYLNLLGLHPSYVRRIVAFYWSRRRFCSLDDLDAACLKHQRRSRHNWQWWLWTDENGQTQAIEMPEVQVRVLVATTTAQTGSTGRRGSAGTDLGRAPAGA